MHHGDMTYQGHRMYRWRGLLPLTLTPVIVFGFLGYHYPMNSHSYDVAWEIFCLSLAFAGLAIRFLVMGYSPPGSSYIGKSTNNPETKKFETTAVYSLCRHPLYLGNFVMVFGILLFLNSIVVMVVYVLLFLVYYERLILAEEDFLSREFGEDYTEWVGQTPLIIPEFSKWKKPDFPFSWRVAVRREYKRIFGVIALMTLFEIVGDFIVTGELELDWEWGVFFFAGLAFYLLIRILKRNRYLAVPRP